MPFSLLLLATTNYNFSFSVSIIEGQKVKIFMDLNYVFRSERVVVGVLAAISIPLARQGKFL